LPPMEPATRQRCRGNAPTEQQRLVPGPAGTAPECPATTTGDRPSATCTGAATTEPGIASPPEQAASDSSHVPAPAEHRSGRTGGRATANISPPSGSKAAARTPAGLAQECQGTGLSDGQHVVASGTSVHIHMPRWERHPFCINSRESGRMPSAAEKCLRARNPAADHPDRPVCQRADHRLRAVGSELDAAVAEFRQPARVFSREEVRARPSAVPAANWVYGWWLRSAAPFIDASRRARRSGPGLLYLGISPREPPADRGPAGRQSSSRRRGQAQLLT